MGKGKSKMSKNSHAYKIYSTLSDCKRKKLQQLTGKNEENGLIQWIHETIKNLSSKQKNDLCKDWRKDRLNLKLWYITEFIKQEGCCYYCEITSKEVRQIYGERVRRWRHDKQGMKIYTRGFKLEIDRENSANKYTPQKCHLVCFPCNCAKSNIFYDNEFKIIGKAIKKVWKSNKHK